MPSCVSKLLPRVSICTEPLTGAVQLYQTEWPPLLPRMSGSPSSRVELTVVPLVVMDVPLRVQALAKLSLPGTWPWAVRTESTVKAHAPRARRKFFMMVKRNGDEGRPAWDKDGSDILND